MGGVIVVKSHVTYSGITGVPNIECSSCKLLSKGLRWLSPVFIAVASDADFLFFVSLTGYISGLMCNH